MDGADGGDPNQRGTDMSNDNQQVEANGRDGPPEAHRSEVPARIGGGQPAGASAPTEVALIQSEPVPLREFLTDLATDEAVEEQRALMEAYDHAVKGLVGPHDVIQEAGREFKRKSAWRKLARFFRISTQILDRQRWRYTVDGVQHFAAEVTVRAVAPWGQYMEAVGSCSTEETRFTMPYPWCPQCSGPMWDNRNPPDDAPDWKKRLPAFTCRDKCGGTLEEDDLDPDLVGKRQPNPTAMAKALHDCTATAQTRATNRATSDLIAAGEVSAEEIEGGDEGPYRNDRSGGGTRPEEPADPMDRRVGFGKHRDLTLRELIERDPDYARWACGLQDGNGGARKMGDAAKAALRDALEGREAERAQEDQQPDGGWTPPDNPLDGRIAGGKHDGEVWSDVLHDDPEYLDRMLDRPWGQEQIPEGSLLRTFVVAGLRDQSIDDPWEAVFLHLVDQAGVEQDLVDAYAELHPDLPDRPVAWTPDHWRGATNDLLRWGADKVFGRAREVMDEREGAASPEEPDGPPIPQAKREEAARVVERAESLGLDPQAEDERMEAARKARDHDAYDGALDDLKQRVLDRIAQGDDGGEDAVQEGGEAPGPYDGVQDDLPF